jgi:hypothetical protein
MLFIASLAEYTFERAMTLASGEISRKFEKQLYKGPKYISDELFDKGGIRGLYQGLSYSCNMLYYLEFFKTT